MRTAPVPAAVDYLELMMFCIDEPEREEVFVERFTHDRREVARSLAKYKVGGKEAGCHQAQGAMAKRR